MRTLTQEEMGNLPSFLFNRSEDDPSGTIKSLEDIPTLILESEVSEAPSFTLNDGTLDEVPTWIWKLWPTLSDRLDCNYVDRVEVSWEEMKTDNV